MARQSRGVPRRAHVLDLGQRPADAADDVRRLLHRYHPRPRHVVHGRPHRLAHLLGREHATRPGQRPHHRSHQRCRPASLVQQWMGRLVQQDLVARTAVHREGDLVAHRPRGEEQRRLLAEQLRHHLLEPVDGRILAILLVAHLGLGHGAAHGRGGTGDGVAEEIDGDRAHATTPSARAAER